MKPKKLSIKDIEWEHRKETILKRDYPYESALLKSDLKTNLKNLPGPVQEHTVEEYHIANDNIRSKIFHFTKIIY